MLVGTLHAVAEHYDIGPDRDELMLAVAVLAVVLVVWLYRLTRRTSSLDVSGSVNGFVKGLWPPRVYREHWVKIGIT